MPQKISILGQRSHKLLVIKEIPESYKRELYCICRCDCGNEIKIRSSAIRYGLTKSCGCLKKDVKSNYIHGLSKTRMFRIWQKMRLRCEKPNVHEYKHYGGRGIKVCKRWSKYLNFYEDMKDTYKDGLTIDRINNNGHYCKKNCRWITMKEQQFNKRTSVFIKLNGVTKNLSVWSKELGISMSTIRGRIKYGHKPKEILSKIKLKELQCKK